MNKMQLIRRDLPYILLVVLMLVAIAGYELLKPKELHGEVIEPPKLMPDFTLRVVHGPVSLSSFHNKLVLLYFGYTFCPDICPTTLGHLQEAVKALGDKSKDVQVIFISVDWKRDTPEIMAKYTARFNPDFLGLTGTQTEIDSVTKDFGVFYSLNAPNSKGFYGVDHTASITVLDRQRRLVVIWPNDTQPSSMTADMQILLNSR